MERSQSFTNRILLVLAILLAIMLSYLVLTEAGRASLFRLFNLSPKVFYTCPLLAEANGSDAGTCSNCVHYPVSKSYRLSETYKPFVIATELPGGGSLIPEARNALRNLFSLAEGAGHSPVVTSAYRSY